MKNGWIFPWSCKRLPEGIIHGANLWDKPTSPWKKPMDFCVGESTSIPDGIGWNWIELDAPHVRLWKSLFKMHLKSLQDLLEHILAWFSWGMFQELRYRNILSSHHPDWSCVDGAPLFEARYLTRKSWENHEHTLWIPRVIPHSFMTSNLATAPVGKNVCQVAQNDSKSMFENVCGS